MAKRPIIYRSTRSHRPRAFLMAEVLVGMGVIALIAVVATMAIHLQARADVADQHRRAALAQVQSAVDSLRTGKPPMSHADGMTIVVTTLPDTSPTGWRWVRVSATRDARVAEAAELTALVPAEAHP